MTDFEPVCPFGLPFQAALGHGTRGQQVPTLRLNTTHGLIANPIPQCVPPFGRVGIYAHAFHRLPFQAAFCRVVLGAGLVL
nr:hypothetical protein [uncultured Kingella sp.]